MRIILEIPDALADQLHLEGQIDLRTLLQALAEQSVEAGGLMVVPTQQATSKATTRPQRDVLSRLRRIYGEKALAGENAVVAARQTERY